MLKGHVEGFPDWITGCDSSPVWAGGPPRIIGVVSIHP